MQKQCRVSVRLESLNLSQIHQVIVPNFMSNDANVYQRRTNKTRDKHRAFKNRSKIIEVYQLKIQLQQRQWWTALSKNVWNQLPSSFRQPHPVHSPPGSSHPAHITSSQSPPSLSPSVTPLAFYSRLKTHLFHKSLLHSLSGSIWSAFTDLGLGLYLKILCFWSHALD